MGLVVFVKIYLFKCFRSKNRNGEFLFKLLTVLKPKLSLIIAAASYVLYLSMFLYPSNAVLYIYSVIIGIGAAVLWTAQGTDRQTANFGLSNGDFFLRSLTMNKRERRKSTN